MIKKLPKLLKVLDGFFGRLETDEAREFAKNRGTQIRKLLEDLQADTVRMEVFGPFKNVKVVFEWHRSGNNQRNKQESLHVGGS
jgi:hypothetical protein